MSLAVEAIRNAIADAGLKPSDIDDIAKYSMDNNSEIDIAANLGIPALRFFGEVGYGGGGGPVGSVMLGAMAVATGMANCVVAFRAMNERSGRGTPRYGQAAVRKGAPGANAYHEPFGLFSPAQMVALAARAICISMAPKVNTSEPSPWRVVRMLRTTPMQSCAGVRSRSRITKVRG